MAEIKLFNEWLETHDVSTSAVALWYALMYIANRSDWKRELCIPASVLCLRTKLSRSAIYKEQAILRDHGLIDFDPGDGRQSSIYVIRGFEERFVSTVVSTTKTQPWTQNEPGEEEQDIMLNNSDLPNESESCRSLSQSEKDSYISIYIKRLN